MSSFNGETNRFYLYIRNNSDIWNDGSTRVWQDAGDAVMWAESVFDKKTGRGSGWMQEYAEEIIEATYDRIEWEELGLRIWDDIHPPDYDDTAIPIN